MHDDCKYSFYSKITKIESRYDSLPDRNIDIKVKYTCSMCGLNPTAVKIIENQPLCQSFENRLEDIDE